MAGGGLGLLSGLGMSFATGGAALPLMLGGLALGGGMGAQAGATSAAEKTATNQANALGQQQLTESQTLQEQLLSQPQNIAPDNFLALKANSLANLRLGLASTMTGAGGSPSPTLSSPSLQPAAQGKTKMGQ